MSEKFKEEMKPELDAFQLKDQGNKYFSLLKYVDALHCYNKAILKNSSVATFYTNRALCYIKLLKWNSAVEDARKALELEPNQLKAHFFLGLAFLELENYDEAIKNIQKAYNLAKDQKLNYGDEIAYSLRIAKKKKFNQIESERITQEIKLQTYLINLIKKDKNEQLNQIKNQENIENNTKLDKLINETNSNFEKTIKDVNDMFSQLDLRRKQRDIPDYLCGKISFEIMKDPVITPSGITYDKKDIEEHLHRVGHFDPVTRHPLTIDQLIPNLSMKEVIDSFLLENEWANEY